MREDGRKVVAPVPGFVMYPRSAQFAGMDFIGVPLKADFTLDLAAMLAAIEEHQPALVFIAYPNNPTGNLYDADDIGAIIEALGDRHRWSSTKRIEPFARTASWTACRSTTTWSSCARCRSWAWPASASGTCRRTRCVEHEFDKVRPPYNVNVLTQVAAEFALDHLDVLNEQAADLRANARSWRPRGVARRRSVPDGGQFPAAARA